jgi:hypothetical protein
MGNNFCYRRLIENRLHFYIVSSAGHHIKPANL